MAVLLLVEDDDDTRAVFTQIFERAGFTVLAESDGVAALHRARRTRPDIVLADLDMPGMDGAELCHAVRSDPRLRDVPVIIVSGDLEPDDQRLRHARACATLVKPITHKHLIDAVRRLAREGGHGHRAGDPACVSGTRSDVSGT